MATNDSVNKIYVHLAGDTMTGPLILNADPTNALGAVTKQYADAISAGFTVKTAVVAASTAALTSVYANGAAGVGATLTNAGAMAAFALDGVSLSLNDRVLIKDQASTLENGIYTVTIVGSGVANWELTRATDYDTPAEIQPGNLIPVNTGTINSQTSWIETATVANIGVDAILFSQFTASPSTFAKIQLDNLSAVAINTSLLPAAENAIDVGDGSHRFRQIYSSGLTTGTDAADSLVISARDIDGAADTPFITLTANNTPTCVLASGVTATTQAPGDNSTKLATTAYADAIGAAGANTALSNLGATAVNTDIIPGLDNSISLGSGTKRFLNAIVETVQTGTNAGNTTLLQAYDTDSFAYTTFATLTANGTPTMSLDGTVTGATQAPSNNSTRLATTAYADAQATLAATTEGALKANIALDNLAAVAINTSLLPAAENAIDVGDGTHRFRQIYSSGLTTGTDAADSLVISARDVDGAVDTPFITLTANNTPTCVLASGVTATTQAALDNSTKLATTAYVDAATGGGSGANTALSNLAAVAINTTLVSDTDITDDLGQTTIRWRNLYASSINTGSSAGNTTLITAHDVDGAVDTTFITLTANNTPTCVLSGAVTGTTQAASDNSTKLATTAYADTQVTTIAANKALSNLASVAINTTLVSDTDVTDSLGTQAIRWNNVYTATVQTGDTAADTLQIGAWDVDGAAFVPFLTFTANNTPTGVIASSMTGTTQAASDNSTKLATTAYADTQVTTIAANKALSNLASVAINTSLLPGTDNSIDNGDGTHRFRQIYSAGLTTGTTAADTLIISARDVDGAVNTPFITLTANNTPTCVLASAVTGTTQAASDNSTKLATTAYADTQVTTIAANKALSNLSSVAINTTLVSDTDNTDDLGSGTVRWKDAFLVGLKTGTSAGNTLTISARDVDGAADTAFITLTANNTPTCVIASAVTGTTQSAGDNSTKLATTAYADAAGSSGGGLTLISTATASSSSTLDFANLLTSTYDNYIITMENVCPGTDNVSLSFRIGTGGTPTYQATNYSGVQCGFTSASGPTDASSGTTGVLCCNTGSTLNIVETSSNLAGTVRIYNANNASAGKRFVIETTHNNASATSNGSLSFARWTDASTAISSTRFLMSSGNIGTGKFKLYGLKN